MADWATLSNYFHKHNITKEDIRKKFESIKHDKS